MHYDLFDYIKKTFLLPLTIGLQDHKEKEFHNAQFSPTDIDWLNPALVFRLPKKSHPIPLFLKPSKTLNVIGYRVKC